MYATDTDHVGIPFVALLAPSEHRVRNTRLQSIMQTAVLVPDENENVTIGLFLLPYSLPITEACNKMSFCVLIARYLNTHGLLS